MTRYIANPTPAQLAARREQQLCDAMLYFAAIPRGQLPAESCRAAAQLLREYDAARIASR